MTDYNDGKWHGWNGGECPVHPESLVVVVRTEDPSGEYAFGHNPRRADDWSWGHSGVDIAIIAFKVVKPYVEPKTIWVNEYPGKVFTISTSEGDARKYARTNATRVAVKFREVRE